MILLISILAGLGVVFLIGLFVWFVSLMVSDDPTVYPR